MEDAPERQLLSRMIRASRFERGLYAEVAADATATRQAVQVVVIVALVTTFSGLIGDLLDLPDLSWFGFNDEAAEPVGGTGIVTGLVFTGIVTGLVFTPIAAIVGWLAWSGAAWLVGTRLIAPSMQDVEFLSVARAIGFADAPGVVGVVAFIPVLGFFVQLAVLLWVLATSFFAIRESMRLSDGQAVATMVVSVIALVILIVILFVGAVLVGAFGAAFGGVLP